MAITRANKENAVLLVVDIQGKILPAMNESEAVLQESIRLIEGAKAFNLPILVTEQYPKGLGETVPEVKAALEGSNVTYVTKGTFSCCLTEDFMNALRETGKKQVIMCGIESHVCVQQTALDLLAMGYEVFMVENAVSSRKKSDKEIAMKRMLHDGIILESVESVLFDMLQTSKAPEFKAISNIVK